MTSSESKPIVEQFRPRRQPLSCSVSSIRMLENNPAKTLSQKHLKKIPNYNSKQRENFLTTKKNELKQANGRLSKALIITSKESSSTSSKTTSQHETKSDEKTISEEQDRPPSRPQNVCDSKQPTPKLLRGDATNESRTASRNAPKISPKRTLKKSRSVPHYARKSFKRMQNKKGKPQILYKRQNFTFQNPSKIRSKGNQLLSRGNATEKLLRQGRNSYTSPKANHGQKTYTVRRETYDRPSTAGICRKKSTPSRHDSYRAFQEKQSRQLRTQRVAQGEHKANPTKKYIQQQGLPLKSCTPRSDRSSNKNEGQRVAKKLKFSFLLQTYM